MKSSVITYFTATGIYIGIKLYSKVVIIIIKAIKPNPLT